MKPQFILGIETSCDETAMSLIKFKETEKNFEIEVLSNVVASQIEIHKKWGGVYPELASRAHLESMIPVLSEALSPIQKFSNLKSQFSNNIQISKFKNLKIENSMPEGSIRQSAERKIENCKLKIIDKIDTLAVTQGPGLIGSLLMGVETAQVLSAIYDKPIVPVNHLEGHIYSAFCAEKSQISKSKSQNKNSGVKNSLKIPKSGLFPILALVVSGGHTSLILMEDHLKYKTVGQTIDDAAGEAFDKVARILELGYPGGPIIEKLAKSGNENKYELPVAMKDSLNFSFSGLKTAVLYLTKDPKTQKPLKFDRADLAASFQKVVVDALILKTKKAITKYQPKTVILGGGVSANEYLRNRFVSEIPFPSTLYSIPPTILIPPKNLSTDNAVGIAIASALKFSKNQTIPWNQIDVLPNFPIGN